MASSSAASTSSNKQNGIGLTFKIANIKHIAVSVFSPPDYKFIEWNEETGQHYAEFKTEDGLNKVWLEDDKSIELRMKAASDAGVAGTAYWKLGMEKSSVWNIIQKFIN